MCIMWHLSFVSNRFDNMFRIELFRNSFPVTNEKENIGGRVENRPQRYTAKDYKVTFRRSSIISG